jgi:hypothetical protein
LCLIAIIPFVPVLLIVRAASENDDLPALDLYALHSQTGIHRALDGLGDIALLEFVSAARH